MGLYVNRVYLWRRRTTPAVVLLPSAGALASIYTNTFSIGPVWGFGVLCLSCVCVGGVVLWRCLCVCVTCRSFYCVLVRHGPYRIGAGSIYELGLFLEARRPARRPLQFFFPLQVRYCIDKP